MLARSSSVEDGDVYYQQGPGKDWATIGRCIQLNCELSTVTKEVENIYCWSGNNSNKYLNQ